MSYNLTLVLKSTLNTEDRKKISQKVKSNFDKAKITQSDWGQKALAYPIKREASGVFINMDIETEERLKSDFEKTLNSDSNILRHLLIRTN
ncbi:MAG: 30S ribosomal protein S6 [Candidatus Levybacteria bacterium RIFCSPLOWO2_01_FULL_39_10]|nr:MAG: 30S ribosomal protein S6 [Candidatus Levybacteria bacterium RIFCSPLOWO2_01_FULL_39_10]